jgi:hypothetical protein
MRWSGHRLAIILFVSVIVVWLAVMAAVMRQAALLPEASGTMLAVFDPGTAPDDIFARLTRADARPVRPTAFGFIWIVSGDRPGLVGRLKQQGALGAYRELPISPTIAGCFAFADARASDMFGL